RDVQIARGPRRTRTGRKNKAASRAKTPFTAMPRMRNGRGMSQTMGKSTTASRATGQHRMNKMHQRKNAAMFDLLIEITYAGREKFHPRHTDSNASAWQWRRGPRHPPSCANLPPRSAARAQAHE